VDVTAKSKMGKPKHITGVAANIETGLTAVFMWSKERRYDTIASIEDLDGMIPVYYHVYKNRIDIIYDKRSDTSVKTYRINFASGDSEDINVIVPIKSIIDNEYLDLEGEVRGPGSDFDFRMSVMNRFESSLPKAVYSVLPQSDPADVFSYENVWMMNSGGIYVEFKGSTLSQKWKEGGYDGGRPVQGVKAIQHASFAAVISDNITEPSEVWEEIFSESGNPAVTGFTWSKDLPDVSPLARKFSVCNDPISPSYYVTTGNDISGTAIPVQYLTGTSEAIFVDYPCTVDCTEFNVRMNFTPRTLNDLGNFDITILGNPASPAIRKGTNVSAYDTAKLPTYPALNLSSFEYDLVVPDGVTYGGTIASGVTSATSYSFVDIPAGPGIWKIQITDVSTGGIIELSVPMIDPSTRSTGTCATASALNYDSASTVTCTDCCLSCTAGYLTRGGIALGQNLILNTGTTISPSTTLASNDGSATFFGTVNTGVDPLMASYLTGTYDIYLYNTTGAGQAMGTLVDSDTGIPNPTYTFNGLASGWYGVQIFSTGELCVSTYYFEVAVLSDAPVPCTATIKYAIDPCSGQFSTNITSPDTAPAIASITYTLNGVEVGSIPPVVSAGDVVVVNITWEDTGAFPCTLYTETYQVTSADLQCSRGEDPTISGCMDPSAVNYNSAATVSDGSCFYGVPGCLDPSASNFNPNATISNGTCTYGISGCIDPNATNYDPNATIDDGSCVDACSELIFETIQVSGGVYTIVFANTPPSYEVSWLNVDTGVVTTVSNSNVAPTLPDGIYVVTVTTGGGCTDTYVLGINDTPLYGCIDPNASNYSPASNISQSYYGLPGTSGTLVGGPCTYNIQPSPCTPRDLDTLLRNLDNCVVEKMNEFTDLMRSGRLKECNTKNTRMIGLLRYLLSRRDLPCLYNCADSMSPNFSGTTQGTPCENKWGTGGPNGTELVWDASTVYEFGDVVKHPTSEDIYTFIMPTPAANMDPESILGESSWEYCREPFAFTDITNRLDPYFAFLAEACRDCGLPPVAPIQHPSTSVPLEDKGTVIDSEPLEINGSVTL